MPHRPRKHALIIGIDRYQVFPHLQGCVHDAEFAAEVLTRRFGFPAPRLLTDAQAGRDCILGALEELAADVGDDDIVVVHYSGHGSQLRCLDGHEADGWSETLVPWDSARAPGRNLDITDEELHRWLLRITRRTPYLTVILDSCHAGTALRAVDASAVRRVEADRRGREAAVQPPTEGIAAARTIDGTADGPSGWLSPALLGKRYTLLAACRDDESAREHDEQGERYGALSWHLYRDLTSGGSRSYRELHARIAPQVTALYRQHPQLEGSRDRVVFGTAELRQARTFPLVAAEGGGVRLGAGRAMGLANGCELAVFPPTLADPDQELPPKARLRITRVYPLSADVEVTDGPEEPQPTDRAILEVQALVKRPIRVSVDSALAARQRQLGSLIGRSHLLRSSCGDSADLYVVGLPRREVVADDGLLPHLGPLDAAHCAVIDASGRLRPPLVREDDPAAAVKLVEVLERWSHHLRFLRLTNEDPASGLAGTLDLRLFLLSPEGQPPQELVPDEQGRTICREGARLGLEVRNHAEVPIYVTVLAFGLLGEIDQIFPPRGGQDLLRPGGQSLRIAMRDPGPALRTRVPDGYPRPAAGGPPVWAEDYLKAIATTQPLDLEPFLRPPLPGTRRADNASHPLARLLDVMPGVAAARNVGFSVEHLDEDWTSVLRSFELAVEPNPKETSSWIPA